MKPNNRQELGRRDLIDLMEKVEGGRDIIDVPSRYYISIYSWVGGIPIDLIEKVEGGRDIIDVPSMYYLNIYSWVGGIY